MDLSSFFDYPTPEPAEHASQLLAEATEHEWERLFSHTELRRLQPGETLFGAGERERALYLVTDGELEMLLPTQRGGEVRFLALAAPTVVGELGFFDGEPRSATVRALTDCEALRLSAESFESLAAREPKLARDVLIDFGRVAASRMRYAHGVIAESMR